LTRAKLVTLNKAAIAACDAADGVSDGLIADPRQCRFDPGTLLCKGAEEGGCLTAVQVAAARKIYAGPRNLRSGEAVFPGWDPGSEAPGGDPKLGWTAYIVGQPEPVRLELWKYWAFGDPGFDWHGFDFDRDLAFADEKMPNMNAVDPDLRRFRDRGGKLLMYFGWADNVSSARLGVDYYESVARRLGGDRKTQDFFRLFLAPGMGHCQGGPGPDSFDAVSALDQWVEQGLAPAQLVATHRTNGLVDRTRPLCPYPQRAAWNGSGSVDEAANFACVTGGWPRPASDAAWLARVQEIAATQRRASVGRLNAN